MPDPRVVGKHERRLLGMSGVLAVSEDFITGDISQENPPELLYPNLFQSLVAL